MPAVNNVSKIGVLSDTHVGENSALPRSIFNVFEDVDLIIHAGDFTYSDVITELEAIAPVIGVKGNTDSFDIHFPTEQLIKINDKFLIAVCHGAGIHMTTKSRMYKKFRKKEPDMIIFGHTHKAEIEEIDGIIMFNPGSATRGMTGESGGIITLENDKIIPEIIKL